MPDTIGGKTFAELGLEIEPEYQRPMAAPTRDYTVSIPNRHGAWDFGADLGPKPFSLPCHLTEETAAGLQAAIDQVTNHLFDATGRPRTLKLVFEEDPEKYTMVRFSGSLPINRIFGIGKFTLPLIAFDPFKYAPSTAYDPTETYYYNTGLQYDSGLMYDNPAGFEWRYRKQYIGLYNYSGIETPVRITVTGSVINPRITNQTTGQKLTVGAGKINELTADSSWYYAEGNVVTSESVEQASGTFFVVPGLPISYKKVTQTTEHKYFLAETQGDYVYLSPGKNSLLFEGGVPSAHVEINWEHKFV